MDLDKLTARGVFTVVIVFIIAAFTVAGIIEKVL